jgi:hypothetical protein
MDPRVKALSPRLRKLHIRGEKAERKQREAELAERVKQAKKENKR